MECFHIDESGYTGFDLLNVEQRFQGAAAVSIGDDEASRLIREHFPKLQAPELKYHALARRPGYRQPLIELQRAVLSQHMCVTYVCDKRFLLILMFLDYAVEPFYYERGHDFYKDGQNYTLASLLYIVGPTLFGKVHSMICLWPSSGRSRKGLCRHWMRWSKQLGSSIGANCRKR